MKRYAQFLQSVIGLSGTVAQLDGGVEFMAEDGGSETITEVGEDYVVCTETTGQRQYYPINLFVLRIGPT